MPLHINKSTTLPVSVSNFKDVLYIKGNESIDGSQRIIYNAPDDFGHFEERIAGQWVLGPVVFNDDAWVIDSGNGEFIFASPQEAQRVRVGLAA